jgi:MbtH protein
MPGSCKTIGGLASLDENAESKMGDRDTDDRTIYLVVVNHEEQYSIWRADQDVPRGWREAGKKGTKVECLAYIKEVWTDMRPLSLRTIDLPN